MVILDTIAHKINSGKTHLKSDEVSLSTKGKEQYESVCRYFLDADLSILGEAKEIYMDYA